MFSLAVFVAGADTIGYLVAGFLYLRVWKKLGDYIFAVLALAFMLLAANELVMVVGYLRGHTTVVAELFRLSAFGLLVAAIVTKSFELGPSNT